MLKCFGKVIVLLAVTTALSGCASAVIGGAAVGGLTLAQERSVGEAVDDLGIQSQINEKLFAYNHSLFLKVNLTVTQGNVVMTGSVPTADDKMTATKFAWQVAGVRSVVNELQITETSITDSARDIWITTQLRARLLTDGDIRDINYTLDTVNGIIYVIGVARSADERDQVLTHASTIKHVKKVVSLVSVAQEK